MAYLRGRVTAAGKAEFMRVAKALGLSESEAVRAAAEQFVKRNGRT